MKPLEWSWGAYGGILLTPLGLCSMIVGPCHVRASLDHCGIREWRKVEPVVESEKEGEMKCRFLANLVLLMCLRTVNVLRIIVTLRNLQLLPIASFLSHYKYFLSINLLLCLDHSSALILFRAMRITPIVAIVGKSGFIKSVTSFILTFSSFVVSPNPTICFIVGSCCWSVKIWIILLNTENRTCMDIHAASSFWFQLHCIWDSWRNQWVQICTL